MLGHDRIIHLLKRLADQNELAHGYICHGPAGAGRKLVMRSLANYLETGSFAEPAGVLSDLTIISAPSAGSIGIDEIRTLKQTLYQSPVRAKRRTIILDDADHLTSEAQNALLKMAEEPPPTGLLVVIVRDPESLEATLRSRLQSIFFGAMPIPQLATWLTEEQGIKSAEARKLALRAGGLPGVALRLQTDPEFQARLTQAEELFTVPVEARRAIIKTLLEPEDFSFREFLDDIMFVLAERLRLKPVAKETELWHNLLALRKNVESFGLNPRLQLESLFFNY